MSIAQPSSMVAWLNIISASQATAIQTQPSVHAAFRNKVPWPGAAICAPPARGAFRTVYMQ